MEMTEKVIIGGLVGLVAVLVLWQFAQGMIPQARYTCPICGEKFMTYDELYQHFTTEHPAEPIDIIWE